MIDCTDLYFFRLEREDGYVEYGTSRSFDELYQRFGHRYISNFTIIHKSSNRIAKDRKDLRYRYGDSFVDHFDVIEEVVYITPFVFAAIDAFKRSEYL